MKQEYLFKPIPSHRLAQFSKEDLIQFIEAQQEVNEAIMRDNDRLRAFNAELEQRKLWVSEQYVVLKNKLFGKSSEKAPRDSQDGTRNKDKKKRVQLPSLRYPNAPLIERHVELEKLPDCICCGTKMHDTGMTEDAEFLTVIPKQFFVVRQLRHKYGCEKCHGEIKTAPAPPRIKEGSSYSDEMVIDVALSKYCDLVPVERYTAIAGREGMKDIPPQSLIESTHNLAGYVVKAYEKLREEIKASKVLHADETPHRMLEGDAKSNWYLWGFSNAETSYFEIKNTRSGDVALDLLTDSSCEFLVSDVFSGYGRAVREVNKKRAELKLREMKNVYCNAHSRRKFHEAKDAFPAEANIFLTFYGEIYHLESEAKEKPPDKRRLRQEMAPKYEGMKNWALAHMNGYSTKSSIGKAMSYFLENYAELTAFTANVELPIDNNLQERLLRSPVIGRKTWYGTHSKLGAKTAAILFSLVESCKLNQVNPRLYFKSLVADIHSGRESYTPYQFKIQRGS